MEQNENQTINLSSNIGPIPGIQSLQDMVKNTDNRPIDITSIGLVTNNTQEQKSETILNTNLGSRQDEINNQAAAQAVVNSTTTVTDFSLPHAEQDDINLIIPGKEEVNISDVSIVKEQPKVIDTKPEPHSIFEDVQTKNSTGFELKDKYVFNTKLIKNLLNLAKKGASCNPQSDVTTIFDIIFDNDKLKIITTDSRNYLILEDKSVGFTNSFHCNIGVNDTINKLRVMDGDQVEFKSITTPNGDKFIGLVNDLETGSSTTTPEIYDYTTGLSFAFDTPDHDIKDTDIQVEIDGIKFKQLIQNVSTGTLNPNLDRDEILKGIYCADKIYASDSNNIFGIANLPQLQQYVFYMPNDLVKLFLSLNFSAKTTMALRKDGDTITNIIFKDSEKTLFGTTSIVNKDFYTGEFPVDILKRYITTDYPCKFTINKQKLESSLKLAELSITPNTDAECCHFELDTISGLLKVYTLNLETMQNLVIQGLTESFNPFYLKIKDLLNILNNCYNDYITFEIDNKDQKNIKIIDNDACYITAIQNL